MRHHYARTVWVDYLRSTLTVLVVAHHASLAYTTFAYFEPQAYILSTHPVVDTRRWAGMDVFENFNDVFFMSLMFFISGIFVRPAIEKKGPRLFIRDRFYRLFVPFLIAVTLLMLLAYYPAWLQTQHQHGISHYITDFFTVEQWPVGPPWFIWVLFAFNLIFSGVYPYIRHWLARAGRSFASLVKQPVLLWLTCWLAIAVSYVPLALWVGAGKWVGWGPFDFQLSRIVWYLVYFVFGIIAGSSPATTGLLAAAKRSPWWPLQLVIAVLAYTTLTLLSPLLEPWVKRGALTEAQGWTIYFGLYVTSATASSLAMLLTFRTLVRTARTWWSSLNDNAYGIYLVHYVFVTWCQYYLLPVGLHAGWKFTITLVVSLGASWLTVKQLRRIPLIRRWL